MNELRSFRSIIRFTMVGLVLLSLLGSSVVQVFAVEFMFNGMDNDHSMMQIHRALHAPLRNNFHWKHFTRSMKNVDEIKKDFEDHLKQAEDILKNEMEKEDVENKRYWELHQTCLEGLESVLESVKEMAEERKSACKVKEQELEDMRKLVSECAKTRVKMQEELSACRKTVAKTVEASRTQQPKSEENKKKAQENVHTNQNDHVKQMRAVHHGSMDHSLSLPVVVHSHQEQENKQELKADQQNEVPHSLVQNLFDMNLED